MEIPLNIEVDNEKSSVCSNTCTFFDSGYCILFSLDLEETTLPPHHEWQDNPTYDRCGPCMSISI